MMIIAVVTNAESLVAVIVGIVARDRRDEEEEDSPLTVTTTAVTFIPAIMRIRVVLDVVGLHQEIIMRRLEVVREEEEKEIIGHHRTTMWIPLDVALEVDPQREHHHHTGAVAVDRATTTIDAKANANANALPALLAMEN